VSFWFERARPARLSFSQPHGYINIRRVEDYFHGADRLIFRGAARRRRREDASEATGRRRDLRRPSTSL
jgi:hypothetical protein